MNREQRRAATKAAKRQKVAQSAVTIQENIDEVSTPRLIVGINSFLIELEKRGVPVRDWDNDARQLRRIQIRHGRFYFLTADQEGGEQP